MDEHARDIKLGHPAYGPGSITDATTYTNLHPEGDERFKFHQHLEAISQEDVRYVRVKDRDYGSSWKKRGGVGAFMMLARKWDRLEEQTRRAGYDIMEVIRNGGVAKVGQGGDGTTLAEVRDLRRYLLLLEAEMVEQGVVELPVSRVLPRHPPATDGALRPQEPDMGYRKSGA